MHRGIARPVHRPVAGPRPVARVLWTAVGVCVLVALVVGAGAALGGGRTSDRVVPSAFAGRIFPVRPIEYAREPKSANRLVRVRCPGRAKNSACWVSRGWKRRAPSA